MPTPRQLAVALRYDEARDTAPKLTAKGWGEAAERIREAARQSGVPVRDDPDLARALAKLDLGEAIPDELFETVASVLAFIYRLNRQAGGG